MMIYKDLLQVQSVIRASLWSQRSRPVTPLNAYCTQRAARLITDAKNTAALVLVNGKGAGANSRLDFLLTAVAALHVRRRDDTNGILSSSHFCSVKAFMDPL